MKKPRVGFIGLGIMGRAMALNLVKAGFDVTVYNRTKASAKPLLSAGANAVATPKKVAELSDVVITMVTDSEAVEQVVLGKGGVIEGAHKGMLFVDMSTVSPKTSRDVSAALSKVGVAALDAPVSGGDTGAKAGTLTIMVGGPKSAFAKALPVLHAMGKKVVHMGDSGAGQLTKLSNQILVAGNMAGLSECLLFARNAGLDLDKLIESLSAGAASSWALVNLGPRIVKGDFAPGFKVKLLQKDLRYVLSTAQETRTAVPSTALVHRLYERLEGEGMGDEGTQALIVSLQELSDELPPEDFSKSLNIERRK